MEPLDPSGKESKIIIKKKPQHITQSRGTLQDDFFIPLDTVDFRLIVKKKRSIPRDYYRHVAALIVLVEPQTLRISLSKSSSPLMM